METSRRDKQEQGLKPYPSHSKPRTATRPCEDRPPPATQDQAKLAATAIRSNVRLRSSDMPVDMQELAFRLARSFSDAQTLNNNNHHRISPSLLARTLKKEFDKVYGPAWHCVVGKSFGSFVTHTPGGFIYFSMDSLFILLFKTEVQLATE